MNLYIWGTGKIAQEYLDLGEIGVDDISGVIETHKRSEFFRGIRVYEPNEIYVYDIILVLIEGKESEVFATCLQNGIDTSKVIFLNNWRWNNDGTSTTFYPQKCACQLSELKI